MSKQSVPQLNHWQQWGLWLGTEIERFPDAVGRIEMQGYITNYIARKHRELQSSRTEADF